MDESETTSEVLSSALSRVVSGDRSYLNYTPPIRRIRCSYTPKMCEAIAYIQRESMRVNNVVPPTIVVLGTIWNIVALIILRKMTSSNSSVVLYLRVFLIMSVLELLISAGVPWLLVELRLPALDLTSQAMCRMWTFITQVFLFSPVWIAVLMIADQTVILWKPKLALSICTNFSAKLITAVIFIAMIVLSVHILWAYELTRRGCEVISLRTDYHYIVWPWLSVSIYSILPLVLILPCNIAVAYGLCTKGTVTRQSSSYVAEPNNDFMLCTLVLTTGFFLTFMPATVTNILGQTMPQNWLYYDPIAFTAFHISNLIFTLLTLSVHAVPLPILVIFSYRFRRTMLDCFCFKRKRTSGSEAERTRLNNETKTDSSANGKDELKMGILHNKGDELV